MDDIRKGHVSPGVYYRETHPQQTYGRQFYGSATLTSNAKPIASIKPQIAIEEPMYKWVNDGDPYCKNDCETYQKQIQRVSFDKGVTWEETGKEQEIISSEKLECCNYRWVNEGDPYCKNDCKTYQMQRQEVSYDGGSTWEETGEEQEIESEERLDCCGEFDNCCEPTGCELKIVSGADEEGYIQSDGGTVVFEYIPTFD